MLTQRLLGVVLAIAWSACATRARCDAPSGFTSLFDGRDLSGWHGMQSIDPRELAAMSPAMRAAKRAANLADVRAHWKVENGELVNDGEGVYLTTDRDFGDIELLIEYKTVGKADSGVYLRATPQVQIWDSTKEGGKWDRGADKGSGGLFNNSDGAAGRDPLVLADRPFGEWNQLRILQIGARTSVWLNGRQTVDHAIMENYWDRSRPLFSKGPIQLQTHGGEIRWRNIFVREIDPEEANRILAARAADGFESVFNGRDFFGWTGPLDSYEVIDGAIVCKPGQGGTIYTEQEYGDFVARMEFKLPPGGNNGLAIRYPGRGNAAYDGMCEVQTLDNTSPQYAQLDPRQYHGSAYAMAAAHRGYLRPPGTWNFQEIAVLGSTIRVELNGYPILDADLSSITEYMNGEPHPGKDCLRGHFGFAGHNDAVAYRNVLIRPIAARDD